MWVIIQIKLIEINYHLLQVPSNNSMLRLLQLEHPKEYAKIKLKFLLMFWVLTTKFKKESLSIIKKRIQEITKNCQETKTPILTKKRNLIPIVNDFPSLNVQRFLNVHRFLNVLWFHSVHQFLNVHRSITLNVWR